MRLSSASKFRPVPASTQEVFRVRAGTGLTALLLVMASLANGTTMVSINKRIPPISSIGSTGALPANTQINFVVALKMRNLPGLQALANDVSNPSSPNYKHFLTGAQVKAQFGPTTADISAVSTYLKSKGLKIVEASKNGSGFLMQGTVTQVQNAFATTIKQVQGKDSLGKMVSFRSNTTALKMPSTLVAKIVDISGIDTYPKSRPRALTQTLTPDLTRILYNTQPSFDNGLYGQGRTMAVSNFDGYRLSNVPIFVNSYGLPVPAGGAGSNIQVVVVGTPSGPGNPQGEGDLDIQMELGQAPLATELIYDGSDLLSVLTKEASDNLADVLSESYGWNPSFLNLNAVHTQHTIMTVQGQTYLLATGDFGTTIEPFSYANFDPDLLQVGGTVATVDDQIGTRVTEVGWSGSGGGWSTNGASFNTLPSWQAGTGVPTNINFRLQPDISLHASGNFGAYEFIYGGGVTTGDGTSFSSPVCCGNLIVLEQRLNDAGFTPRIGRVNDFLYSLNGDPAVFFDVTVGNNGTLPNGQQSNAGVGWDFVTGWGAPDFDALYAVMTAGGGGGSTSVPPDPGSINTVIGTYDGGDAASLATTDNVYYEVDSAGFAQFGTAAGIDATFTLPGSPSQVSIKVLANGNADGGASMVWAMNWNTSQWELVGSAALFGDQPSSPASIKIQPSKLANYVNGANQITLRLRGHYPDRPLSGVPAGDFTYQVDLFELSVR